jgi:hypothetical protein
MTYSSLKRAITPSNIILHIQTFVSDKRTDRIKTICLPQMGKDIILIDKFISTQT